MGRVGSKDDLDPRPRPMTFAFDREPYG